MLTDGILHGSDVDTEVVLKLIESGLVEPIVDKDGEHYFVLTQEAFNEWFLVRKLLLGEEQNEAFVTLVAAKKKLSQRFSRS